MKPTENVKGSGNVRVLKLQRETLRELDAGELEQAQGGAGRTEFWPSERGSGRHTKHCDTTRACVRDR